MNRFKITSKDYSYSTLGKVDLVNGMDYLAIKMDKAFKTQRKSDNAYNADFGTTLSIDNSKIPIAAKVRLVRQEIDTVMSKMLNDQIPQLPYMDDDQIIMEYDKAVYIVNSDIYFTITIKTQAGENKSFNFVDTANVV